MARRGPKRNAEELTEFYGLMARSAVCRALGLTQNQTASLLDRNVHTVQYWQTHYPKFIQSLEAFVRARLDEIAPATSEPLPEILDDAALDIEEKRAFSLALRSADPKVRLAAIRQRRGPHRVGRPPKGGPTLPAADRVEVPPQALEALQNLHKRHGLPPLTVTRDDEDADTN